MSFLIDKPGKHFSSLDISSLWENYNGASVYSYTQMCLHENQPIFQLCTNC